jgi:hypothetical protein
MYCTHRRRLRRNITAVAALISLAIVRPAKAVAAT